MREKPIIDYLLHNTEEEGCEDEEEREVLKRSKLLGSVESYSKKKG